MSAMTMITTREEILSATTWPTSLGCGSSLSPLGPNSGSASWNLKSLTSLPRRAPMRAERPALASVPLGTEESASPGNSGANSGKMEAVPTMSMTRNALRG